MKVCFVSLYSYGLFEPKANVTYGGAEVDLYYIGQELAKDPAFQVSFVVGDFGQHSKETFGKIAILKSFTVYVRGWRRVLYALFFAPVKLWTALNRASADIYVQEGAGLETGVIALFCQIRRKKFVYRAASTIDCNGDFIRSHPLTGRVFLYGLCRAAARVTEDTEEANLLQKHHTLAAQAIYDTTPLTDLLPYLPVNERGHVLWVGRLTPMKRPEYFLTLAERFPREQFVFVSPREIGQTKFFSSIERRASTIQNLTFIPGLSHKELEPYFQHAKLLINTSDFEGYPNTFIEAGKYGVPILSLRVNPDGLLTNGQMGDCAFGDLDRFYTLVREWLDNFEKRERAGSAWQAYVHEHNDLRKNIQQYKTLFASLVTTS